MSGAFSGAGVAARTSASRLADADVVESKLSVFQSFDAPVAPGSRGVTFFSTSVTPAVLQQRCWSQLTAEAPDCAQSAAAARRGQGGCAARGADLSRESCLRRCDYCRRSRSLQPLESTCVFGNEQHSAAFAADNTWSVRDLSSYVAAVPQGDDDEDE